MDSPLLRGDIWVSPALRAYILIIKSKENPTSIPQPPLPAVTFLLCPLSIPSFPFRHSIPAIGPPLLEYSNYQCVLAYEVGTKIALFSQSRTLRHKRVSGQPKVIQRVQRWILNSRRLISESQGTGSGSLTFVWAPLQSRGSRGWA